MAASPPTSPPDSRQAEGGSAQRSTATSGKQVLFSWLGLCSVATVGPIVPWLRKWTLSRQPSDNYKCLKKERREGGREGQPLRPLPAYGAVIEECSLRSPTELSAQEHESYIFP